MFDITYKKPFEDEKDWPKTETGEIVRPAFLAHLTDSQIEADMTVNMLRAFKIPVLRYYPNDGEFGRIVLGCAGSGVDIYVPETMLSDAQNILSADTEFETEA